MEPLAIAPTNRVLLGEARTFRILLVGCGGTGSSLARFLAGLAFHARQKGLRVELTLVDDDVVTMANCGRQALSVQAALAAQSALASGVPKVADLALRLNAAYGLDVAAWPVKFEADLTREWFDPRLGAEGLHLLAGCVDTTSGRQEMAQAVEAMDGRLWALDAGNERWSGQVLLGNLTDLGQIRFDPLGLVSGLPSPCVQEPSLLVPDENEQAPSCAELALAEAQSLMVNRLAATLAAHYVTEMVLRREVCQMATYFNLSPTAMRPVLVTEENVKKCMLEKR